MNNDQEEWRWIPGYEGMYMVSSIGNVRSHKRKKWKIMIPTLTKGYKTVPLQIGPKDFKRWYVHRLVCLAFIPNKNKKPSINHKDSNRLNNHISNLEWVTPKENTAHMIKNPAKNVFLGCRNPKSKLSEKQVLEIKSLINKKNGYELARMFNVTPRVIYQIRKNEIWKHLKDGVING